MIVIHTTATKLATDELWANVRSPLYVFWVKSHWSLNTVQVLFIFSFYSFLQIFKYNCDHNALVLLRPYFLPWVLGAINHLQGRKSYLNITHKIKLTSFIILISQRTTISEMNESHPFILKYWNIHFYKNEKLFLDDTMFSLKRSDWNVWPCVCVCVVYFLASAL